jgi:hypothetical protein
MEAALAGVGLLRQRENMSIKRTDLYLYKTSSSTNEKMKALSN